MVEIERKYKVKNADFINEAKISYKIFQGYLNSSAERTVRIRTKNEKGFITIKGKSNQTGISRFEWEKEIPYNDAIELLKLCEDFIIEKTRYIIEFDNKTFEVDIFEGENLGLIIAEIELNNENEHINLPNWIDEEVSGNEKYYNSYISNHPYSKW